MEQREFIVEPETAGQRIDRFLSGEDTGLSRSALQALVADGHVLCNGKLVAKSLKLKAGDTILLEIPDAKPIEAVPQDIPLDIVYEDEHLLVVNKPKGMVVHPAPGNPDGTLVNALLWHCKGSLSGIGGGIYYLAGTGQYVLEKSILGMGFNGIPVALLASSNPIGTIFASLFISYIQVGGAAMQPAYSSETIDIVIAVIIYLAAFALLMRGIITKAVSGHKGKEGAAK